MNPIELRLARPATRHSWQASITILIDANRESPNRKIGHQGSELIKCFENGLRKTRWFGHFAYPFVETLSPCSIRTAMRISPPRLKAPAMVAKREHRPIGRKGEFATQ